MAFDRTTFLDLLGIVSASPFQYANEAARLLARDMVADREGRGIDCRGQDFAQAAQSVAEVPLPIDEEAAVVSNGAGPRLAQMFYSYRRALFPGVMVPFARATRVVGSSGNLGQLLIDGAAAGGGDYTTARAAWNAQLTADEDEIESGRLRARFEASSTSPRFRTRHIIQDFAYTASPYVTVHILAGDYNFRIYGRSLTSESIVLNFDTTPFATFSPTADEPFDFSTTETVGTGDIDMDLGGCPTAVLQIWQD